MSDPSSDGTHLVFGDFLEHLRRQGFTIGVDHYLRLQELLNKVSDNCTPSDLKTILCPIIASNEIEQSQFYSAFDSYFALFHSVVDTKTSEPVDEKLSVVPKEPKPMAARKWPYALGASLIVALALTLAIVLAPKPQGPAPQFEPGPQSRTHRRTDRRARSRNFGGSASGSDRS